MLRTQAAAALEQKVHPEIIQTEHKVAVVEQTQPRDIAENVTAQIKVDNVPTQIKVDNVPAQIKVCHLKFSLINIPPCNNYLLHFMMMQNLDNGNQTEEEGHARKVF